MQYTKTYESIPIMIYVKTSTGHHYYRKAREKNLSIAFPKKTDNVTETRICQRCGKEFVLNHLKSKYCKECISIIRKKAMKKRNCARCGKEFKPTSANQRYCKECRIIIDKERLMKRQNRKRQEIIENEPLEGHHINNIILLYIPKSLHQSIPHNRKTSKGMIEINKLALKWFKKQKQIRLISRFEELNSLKLPYFKDSMRNG